MSEENYLDQQEILKKRQEPEQEEEAETKNDELDHISKRLKKDSEYHQDDADNAFYFNEPNPNDFIIEDDGKKS